MNSVLKWGLIAVLGLTVSACSSAEGKFKANCQVSLGEEGLGEIAAKTACDCAFDRLSDSLSGKELSQATEVISLSGDELQTYIEKNPKGADILEAAEGAMKSCAS